MTQLLRLLIVGFVLSTGAFAQSNSRNMSFSVFDELGLPVKGVKVSDLHLRIAKTDVPIVALNENANQPLDVLVLVDRSISQEGSIDKQKEAISFLIKNTLGSNRDRVAIASFADKVVLHSDLTEDLTSAIDTLPSIKIEYPPGYFSTPRGNAVFVPPGGRMPTSGGTAVWDSIWNSAAALGGNRVGSRRKVILVFSDGFNAVGTKKRVEALAQVGLHQVAVFFVGIGDPKFDDVDRKGLRRFAEEANGLAVFPNKKMTDLNEIVLKVASAMRNSYSLTYNSSNSRGEVQITLPSRKGVNVSSFVN